MTSNRRLAQKTMGGRAVFPEPAGIFGLAAFWLLCLFSGQNSLFCGDTLWHIKVGQGVLETGQIPRYDIYSHTASNQPWIAHEWLSEVLMAFCHKLGGLPGVALLFFFLVSLTIILLYKSAQKLSNDWAAFIAVSIAFAVAQTHLLARPHIITWLFGSLFLYLLIDQDRRIWLLPALTALWGNFHGGVLIGIVLQGAFLLGHLLDSSNDMPWKAWRYHWPRINRQFYVFLLSLIAIGLNPFGYSLLWFPFQVNLEIFSQNITEWQALDLQHVWYAQAWVIIIILLMLFQRRGIPWAWRLLIVFLLYQAIVHVRHLSIAALFLAPWVAMSLAETFNKYFTLRRPQGKDINLSVYSGPLLLCLSFMLMLSLSFTRPEYWQRFTNNAYALPERYSQGALSYLQEHGYPGERLFNEYTWGGYLLFSLDPPPKIFIDGRADMYGGEVFSDYLRVTKALPESEEILARHNIDWIIFTTDSPLIRHMDLLPEWKKVYSDQYVSILVLN